MGLLKSPDVIIATTAIVDKGKTKAEVQQEIKKKEAAVKRLVRKFSNDDVSEENIEWCLYSIGDNSAFLVFNRDPVDQMIGYLTSNFPADLAPDHTRSLTIRSGYKGARLSHPHSQQFQYCLQTLTLWREIQVLCFLKFPNKALTLCLAKVDEVIFHLPEQHLHTKECYNQKIKICILILLLLNSI